MQPVAEPTSRRAELGQAKRGRTRLAILQVAFDLMAREDGRIEGIEEFCSTAEIARGTFYNYFRSITELQLCLSQELGLALFNAVSEVVDSIDDPIWRLAAGVRYYLELPSHDPEWAWALVNTSMIGPIYGMEVNEMLMAQIGSAIEQGLLSISSAQLGHDIIAGAGLVAARTILRRKAPDDYPHEATLAILRSFGVSEAAAAAATAPPLQALATIYKRPFFDAKGRSELPRKGVAAR